ncbi:MAG: chorismate mutase [Rhizobiaceae bacterium]|jgi:chorismate mutase
MSDGMDEARAKLAEYRASIDNFDAALIHILAERFRCTKAVGVLKATHGLPPADPAREQQQIERLRRLAHEAHLDPDFAEKFLNFVVKEVIRHHERIAAENGDGKSAASGVPIPAETGR